MKKRVLFDEMSYDRVPLQLSILRATAPCPPENEPKLPSPLLWEASSILPSLSDEASQNSCVPPVASEGEAPVDRTVR